MSIEPNMSAHLHGAIEGRLQNMDKQREIDLYYELLNSGHSVGEILNAVGSTRSKSKHADTATSDHPQSELDGVTDVASEAALVDTARANALCLPGLGVTEEAESYRTEKPQVTQSPLLNRSGSDDGEQLLGKSLPRSEPEIVGLAGAHASLSQNEAVRSESLERLERSKDPSVGRRVALLAVCTIAISSILIAGFSIILGGRGAEKIQFDQYSAGAESDLQEATRLARRMVTHWGMSERLGPVAYHTSEENPFLGREIAQHERQFSEHTAQLIDEEVEKFLHAAEDLAKRTLQQNSDKLAALADALLEREVLDEKEISELIGPSVNESRERSVSVGPAQVAQVRE